jgi:hypothetical protein
VKNVNPVTFPIDEAGYTKLTPNKMTSMLFSLRGHDFIDVKTAVFVLLMLSYVAACRQSTTRQMRPRVRTSIRKFCC